MDEAILKHAKEVDEVWHAGDFGSLSVAEALQAVKPLRGVYGNIDGTEIRTLFPEKQVFDCEGMRVLMIHIGGSLSVGTPIYSRSSMTRSMSYYTSTQGLSVSMVNRKAVPCSALRLTRGISPKWM